jgi:hypothetical protein
MFDQTNRISAMKNYGVIFILIALFQLHLGATEYHVSKTGHDSNPGTLEEPFLTISGELLDKSTEIEETITIAPRGEKLKPKEILQDILLNN